MDVRRVVDVMWLFGVILFIFLVLWDLGVIQYANTLLKRFLYILLLAIFVSATALDSFSSKEGGEIDG